MEEKNIKGEYLNLSPVDNQENMKFNLISYDKKQANISHFIMFMKRAQVCHVFRNDEFHLD